MRLFSVYACVPFQACPGNKSKTQCPILYICIVSKQYKTKNQFFSKFDYAFHTIIFLFEITYTVLL